jgi:hypothetical protein
MKEFRNRVYTIYNNVEVELSQNEDNSYHLISRNGVKPDETFQSYSLGEGIYTKDVAQHEILNAFSVQTFANYKGFTWQVDLQDGEKVRLSIGNNPGLPDSNMISQGWYEIWVSKSDIEKLWEERKDAWFEVPFPQNFPRYRELKLD